MSGRTSLADMEKAVGGANDIRLFLLFGPEESMAEDGARRLVAAVGEKVERIDLDGSDLRGDPARLADEAASISLFGDVRCIRLRLGGNDPVDAIANLLDAEQAGTPVIATAGNLTKGNKLRKLAEGHKRAMTLVCYAPDAREGASMIHDRAERVGLHMSRPMAEAIYEATNGDPILADQEIEKLALYLDATPDEPKEATPEMLAALGARTAEDDLSGLVHVVMSGKLTKLRDELDEARHVGLNAIRIVKALERRVTQLVPLRSEIDGGRPPGQVVKGTRSIFWKEQGDFIEELRLWQAPRLAHLNRRLIDLEGDIMSAPGSMADLLLGNGLTAICRAAAQAGRRSRY